MARHILASWTNVLCWALLSVSLLSYTAESLDFNIKENHAKVVASKEKYTGKFAYATLHYEGTPHDAEYRMGVRVLVKSIKTHSSYPVIVLVSDNVDMAFRRTLQYEGAIVQVRTPACLHAYCAYCA